jgi:hypothetical protein
LLIAFPAAFFGGEDDFGVSDTSESDESSSSSMAYLSLLRWSKYNKAIAWVRERLIIYLKNE